MRRLLVLALPLFVIGCDSPGGGGGGGPVDCSVTPNLPICRPDTSTNADTSDPDTNVGPGDTTQPDTNVGPEDTVQPDTQVQPDTTQPDTITPDCSVSQTRCVGAEAQACSAGSWVTVAVCDDGTTCQNGVCVPASVCSNGTRRCSGNNVEVCSGGQWTTEQACTNGCSNNQCTAAPTGLACDDVFQCIIDAGCFNNLPTPPTTACMNPCLNQGSTTGKNEMNAMISCYGSCSYDDACIINTCYQQRANCFFDTSGSLSCAAIDSCIGGCTTGACTLSCYEQGTNSAQGQYLRVSECLDGYCGEDQTCWGQVISSGGPCEQAFDICFP
jgi:hypothetical protein